MCMYMNVHVYIFVAYKESSAVAKSSIAFHVSEDKGKCFTAKEGTYK